MVGDGLLFGSGFVSRLTIFPEKEKAISRYAGNEKKN
jgi:hypothetical protein